MDDAQIVAELQAQLQERIGPDRFGLWFGRNTNFRLAHDRLTVFSASTFSRDWLRRHFSRDLVACCRALVARDVRVEFEVDECLEQAACDQHQLACAGELAKPGKPGCRKTPAAHDHDASAARPIAGQKRPPANTRPGHARPEPNFASLVVGKCNEYAVTAAQLVARRLQQASPLLFYGSTGVGKTHLLRAVLTEHRRGHPRARAVYLTAEQFTTGFIEALRGSGLPSFRQKCRGADLFLLDDLQFFVGKRASLDELLHTIDTLQAEGRQLLLAADRGLADLRALGQELVSRLAGGLTCEIQPPDYTTRLGVVRQMADEMELTIDDNVAAMVAAQITPTARELRGALYRLQAVSMTLQQPIGRELAAKALAELAQQSTPIVRLADVEQAVCSVFGVERTDLRSDRKSRAIHEPRMLAMWLARKYTRAPWSEIGQFFGRRSHSTVIAAHHRVEQLIRSQAQIGLSNETCGVEDAIRRVETALRTA
jgi:chromosomal replication initiator protein